MDYQSKKDVNVAAELWGQLEKESATCRQCRQRKSYGSNQHCEGKSHRNEPYRTGEGSTSQRQNKRNDGLIHPVKCN